MDKELVAITSLIGDPIRTQILWSLLDGKAYTATELAIAVDTSPQNISMHLKKLVQADLLIVESQGRHKYYRFSRQEVAYAIEAIGCLIPEEKHKKIISDKDNFGIKYCRTCYDHLAGKIGVLITEGLIKQGVIQPHGSSYKPTNGGLRFFDRIGVDINELKKCRRSFARQCLDWSERRHHLAGALGAALLERMFSLGWLQRMKGSRAVIVTSKGQLELYQVLKLAI
jgi:DNA-binding transcriptional ArsR family regulator